MGIIVFSPLAQGTLTGRVRRGKPSELTRSGAYSAHLEDENRLDVVEELIGLAAEAGIPLTHMATAFMLAHPGVSSAIIGPRTTDHLDDLISGADILDRIDEIVPPGTDAGPLQMPYTPPALTNTSLRRRPLTISCPLATRKVGSCLLMIPGNRIATLIFVECRGVRISVQRTSKTDNNTAV